MQSFHSRFTHRERSQSDLFGDDENRVDDDETVSTDVISGDPFPAMCTALVSRMCAMAVTGRHLLFQMHETQMQRLGFGGMESQNRVLICAISLTREYPHPSNCDLQARDAEPGGSGDDHANRLRPYRATTTCTIRVEEKWP
jgi:hypothetical protein